VWLSLLPVKVVVLATCLGNLPVVQVWTTTTGWFGSRPVQKPAPLTLCWPNLDLYLSTHGVRWVRLDPSVPISCSAIRVSHLKLHSDRQLIIIQYWHWYVMVYLRCIGQLNKQNVHTYVPYHILKMSVNAAWTNFGLPSSVIWVALD